MSVTHDMWRPLSLEKQEARREALLSLERNLSGDDRSKQRINAWHLGRPTSVACMCAHSTLTLGADESCLDWTPPSGAYRSVPPPFNSNSRAHTQAMAPATTTAADGARASSRRKSLGVAVAVALAALGIALGVVYGRSGAAKVGACGL